MAGETTPAHPGTDWAAEEQRLGDSDVSDLNSGTYVALDGLGGVKQS